MLQNTMERRRLDFVLWLTGLLLVTAVLYSTLKLDEREPVMSKKDQPTGVVQRVFQLPYIWSEQSQEISSRGEKDTLLIPGDDVLHQMDAFHLEELWMRYVENIQEACGFQYHNGAEVDGGYYVCERYMARNNCLVYSFGSRKMYSFEDDIIKNYGCEVHTFDPYDGQVDHQHSPNCTFHAWGISPTDKGKLYRLTTIKKMLNHTGMVLDILKIDVEGGEWAALPEIIASGELASVKLLIMEFHVFWPRFRTVQQYLTRFAALKDMYALGFRLYYFRLWTRCSLVDKNKKAFTACHEVHFMKVN